MGGFLGLNIVYTYAASGEVTGQNLDTAWSCTNLWSGLGILFSPVFSGASCSLFILSILGNLISVTRFLQAVFSFHFISFIVFYPHMPIGKV